MQCICYNHTIQQIVEQAIANCWNIEQIKIHTNCGTACGMCIPYIHDALREAGATGFSVP